MSSPEQLTQKVIDYIEKSILGVLFESKQKGIETHDNRSCHMRFL